MVTVNTQQVNNGDQQFDYPAWCALVSNHYSPNEAKRIIDVAQHLQQDVHHQYIFGEPEPVRSLRICEILIHINLDADAVVATLLHVVHTAGELSIEQIKERYGDAIADLVLGINKMGIVDSYQLQMESVDQRHAESVRKLLLALAEDIRVVLIKIAERLHTMRYLRNVVDEIRQIIATETQAIYAPLASRLGMWQTKWELEDLAFRYLEPETYQYIAKMLNEKRIDREQYIERMTSELKAELDKAGIECVISGRPKHIHSIWRKMQNKGVGFNELFDVRATRVLVNSVTECYAVLGVVHNKWRPIRSEFDDYIAMPKDNNYQSLHTAVIGPEDKTIEIQIRTHEMHNHAEFGIAAHWGYKEGSKPDSKYNEKIAWIRQVLTLKDSTSDIHEIVEQFRSEVFTDRVYVLTPKGKVIDMPKGATPLDFAYYIHTEIGHRFRGAKADGKIIPIGYELKSGQQVEILTSKHSKPSRDWLNPHLGYIKCPRTRAKVRAWFKHQDFDRNAEAGHDIVDRELGRLGIGDISHEVIAQKFNHQDTHSFFAAVGLGDITAAQLAGAINELVFPKVTKDANTQGKIAFKRRSLEENITGDIKIVGVGDLMVQLARCCKPVPYDGIVGYITRGRGVTVHRDDCPNLLRLKELEHERVIEVSWGHNTQSTYPVDIYVSAFDRQGLLKDIITILTNRNINVMSVNTNTDPHTYYASMSFSVEVSDLDQLSEVLIKIEHLPNVMQVSRKSPGH